MSVAAATIALIVALLARILKRSTLITESRRERRGNKFCPDRFRITAMTSSSSQCIVFICSSCKLLAHLFLAGKGELQKRLLGDKLDHGVEGNCDHCQATVVEFLLRHGFTLRRLYCRRTRLSVPPLNVRGHLPAHARMRTRQRAGRQGSTVLLA